MLPVDSLTEMTSTFTLKTFHFPHDEPNPVTRAGFTTVASCWVTGNFLSLCTMRFEVVKSNSRCNFLNRQQAVGFFSRFNFTLIDAEAPRCDGESGALLVLHVLVAAIDSIIVSIFQLKVVPLQRVEKVLQNFK
jgi:hypothetical protein